MAFHFEKPVFETLITSAATVSNRIEHKNQGGPKNVLYNSDNVLWFDYSPYGFILFQASKLNRMPYRKIAGLDRNCDKKLNT